VVRAGVKLAPARTDRSDTRCFPVCGTRALQTLYARLTHFVDKRFLMVSSDDHIHFFPSNAAFAADLR
jgi:hypothetical protein